jgi:hypothetical protein
LRMPRRRALCSNFQREARKADVNLEGTQSGSHAASAKNVRVCVAKECFFVAQFPALAIDRRHGSMTRRRVRRSLMAKDNRAPRRMAMSSDVKPRPDSRSSSSAVSHARMRSLAGSFSAAISLRTRLDFAFEEPTCVTAIPSYQKRVAEPRTFVTLPSQPSWALHPFRLAEKALLRIVIARRFQCTKFGYI